MAKPPSFPMALPGGEMLPFMSKRDREHQALAIYIQAGGDDRLVAILEKSDDKFYDWAKEATVKRIPKPVEHSTSEGVEALLEKLDRAERAKTINGDFKVVTPND